MNAPGPTPDAPPPDILSDLLRRARLAPRVYHLGNAGARELIAELADALERATAPPPDVPAPPADPGPSIRITGRQWGDMECWCLAVAPEEYRRVTGEEPGEDSNGSLYPGDIFRAIGAPDRGEFTFEVRLVCRGAPIPDAPPPDPGPPGSLADALRPLRESAMMIDAKQLVPMIARAERLEEAYRDLRLRWIAYGVDLGETRTERDDARAERDAARREVERLRVAIVEHRDQRGDDRCWLDDLKLYSVIGDGADPYDSAFALPPREMFLKSCARYWAERQPPNVRGDDRPAGCMTIRQLQDRLEAVEAERDTARREVSALRSERDDLLAALSDATRDADHHSREADELAADLAAARREAGRLRGALDAAPVRDLAPIRARLASGAYDAGARADVAAALAEADRLAARYEHARRLLVEKAIAAAEWARKAKTEAEARDAARREAEALWDWAVYRRLYPPDRAGWVVRGCPDRTPARPTREGLVAEMREALGLADAGGGPAPAGGGTTPPPPHPGPAEDRVPCSWCGGSGEVAGAVPDPATGTPEIATVACDRCAGTGAGPGRVLLDYTNYRGERSVRVVEPLSIRWGSNRWHPQPQWLLEAADVEKGAARTFALKDIHRWRPAPAGEGPSDA